MSRGVKLAETIDTRQPTPAAVVAMVEAAVAEEPEHRLLLASPNTLQIMRRARPSALSPFRRTETLMIHVSSRAGRVVLEVSGACSAALVERLRSIGASKPMPAPPMVVQRGAAARPPVEPHGETVLRADQQAAGPTSPSGARVLCLPDGGTEIIDCRLVLGRNPEPSDVPGPQRPVVLTDRSVSKTHCEIWVDSVAVLVMDRHSRNGTSREMPGAGPLRLPPGEPVAVEVGAVIRLGQLSLTIGSG